MYLRDSRSLPSYGQPSRLVVLTLGLSQPIEEDGLAPFQTIDAKNTEDALRILTEGGVAALLLGPRADLLQVPDLLARSAAKPSGHPALVTIVYCVASEPDHLQKLVDAGRVFYVARGEVNAEQLRNLIISGSRHFALMAVNRDRLGVDVESPEPLLDLCTRLPMQTDLASAGRLLIETARDLLQAKIVQCFVYDPYAETLTAADASESEKRTYSAASGLVAFVARTGEHVRLDCLGTDPRYDFDIDAPLEMRTARFLAEPIRGSAGLTACVLKALRGTDQEPFTDDNIRTMELLAECAAPTFNQILLQNRVEAVLAKRASGSKLHSEIFRQEALDYYLIRWDHQGDVLKVVPTWLRRAFWVALVMFLASLLALAFLLHGFRNIFGKVN